MQKILITGTSGRIGNALISSVEDLFNSEDEISLLEHKSPIRLPSITSLRFKIIEHLKGNYDLCLHLAANTDTAYCQKKPEEVKVDNVDLTRQICELSGRVLLTSTDYVFNGNLSPGGSYRESDTVNPFNVYGETKARAEEVVLENHGVVLRLETMMGVPNKIVDAARDGITGKNPDYYPPYRNFWIRPSNFPDFVNVLKRAVKENKEGVYHVSCDGNALSRAEMAETVLHTYKEKGWETKIDEFETELCGSGKRFVLGTGRARRDFGISFTDSREAIRNHISLKI